MVTGKKVKRQKKSLVAWIFTILLLLVVNVWSDSLLGTHEAHRLVQDSASNFYGPKTELWSPYNWSSKPKASPTIWSSWRKQESGCFKLGHCFLLGLGPSSVFVKMKIKAKLQFSSVRFSLSKLYFGLIWFSIFFPNLVQFPVFFSKQK